MQLPHAAGFYQELGIFRAREFCIVVAQEASSMLPSRIDSQISFSVARLQDCDRLNGGIIVRTAQIDTILNEPPVIITQMRVNTCLP